MDLSGSKPKSNLLKPNPNDFPSQPLYRYMGECDEGGGVEKMGLSGSKPSLVYSNQTHMTFLLLNHCTDKWGNVMEGLRRWAVRINGGM